MISNEMNLKKKSKMAAALKRFSDDLQLESQTGFVGQKHVWEKEKKEKLQL